MLPKIKYNPVKEDKLFFISGCNIPRFKVKKFCTKTNTAVVKYANKATIKFIGPDTIRCYIDSLGGMLYDNSVLINHITKFMHIDMVNYGAHCDLINALSTSGQPCCIVMHYAIYYNKSDISNLKILPLFNGSEVVPSFKFKEGGYELYCELQLSSNIYNQDELLNYINDGNIMTHNEFISIQRMFNSSDKQNIVLAMETMANCDYQKSAVYLLLLIRDFGNQIYNQPTKHHVNFKSLCKYFNIDTLSNFNCNDIITTLINKKLLNKQNLDKLMPVISEDLIASNEFFKVKELEYDDNIEKALHDNILDKDHDTTICDEEEELNPKL